MIKKTAAMLAAVSLLNMTAIVGYAKNSDVTILYVAGNGNNANDGSKEKPFADVEKARDEIRRLKKEGSLGKDGAVVYIREGIYQQSKTIEFTEEDSGTGEAPIVYRSYPGETAEFVGGITIPTNKLKKTTDISVLDKVIERQWVNNIYEVNLYTEIGMTEIPKMFYPESYGLTTVDLFGGDPEKWGAKVLEKMNVDVSSNAFEVFVDNVGFNNARYPDDEYMTIKKAVSASHYRGRSDGLDAPAALKKFCEGTLDERAVFVPSDSERVKKWADHNVSDVYIWFQATYGWADEGNKVESVNSADGAVTCAFPTFYGAFTEGNPVYFYNFFDEISPNEFYIDRTNGILYLCLEKKPEDLEDITISVLESAIFKTNGARNISFKNLKMGKTRGECILMNASENIVADNCEIYLTSARIKAIYIDKECRSCGVKNSYFHDVNGGITVMAGDKVSLTRGNCYVINCEFENFARLHKTYTASIQLSGIGNRAAYNEIHGAEHMALGWSDNFQTVEFNEIYDVCTLTDDAAAVYVGRDLTNGGNVCRYNYIHDVGRKGQKSSAANGSHGIYLDDGYSSADIVGNVLENIANYGIFVGGGQNNVIFNNVIINSERGIFCDERYINTAPEDDMRIKGRNLEIYKNNIWKELMPDFYNMDLTKAGPPANNRFENNLIYGTGPNNIYASAAELGVVENNWQTNEDPGFVDIENHNYLLKENAAVYSKIEGFLPIPFTRMGRCIERAEQRIRAATVTVINSPKAYVNGKLAQIDDNENITPEIINDKTYLPVRFLAEANGFEVEFDEETKTVSISNDSDEVNIKTDTGEVVKNGQGTDSLEVIIKDGRTMLPMRSVSEMLGKQVFWDDRGFVSVSDIENLFSSDNDEELIDYIYSQLNIY